MYNDIYATQQLHEDRVIELMQSHQHGRADEAMMRLFSGRIIKWLGIRMTNLGQNLQSNREYLQPVRVKINN